MAHLHFGVGRQDTVRSIVTGLTDDTGSDLFQELRKGSTAGGEGRICRWRPRAVGQGDEGADASGAAADSCEEEDGEEDEGVSSDAAMYWMPDALMVSKCARGTTGLQEGGGAGS